MSELDRVLSAMDHHFIYAQAKEAKTSDLRIATAISFTALMEAGRFTRDLFTGLREAPNPVSTDLRSGSSFDAGVFETAAFIHYSLLAKYLGSPDDEAGDDDDLDEDKDSDEADPYFVAVRDAHHLTGGILNSLVSFGANEEVFLNRPIAYAMRGRQVALVEMFEGVLIEAVETGVPATLHSKTVSLSLGLTLIAGLRARNFFVTKLPALVKLTRNVVEHADDLGL